MVELHTNEKSMECMRGLNGGTPRWCNMLQREEPDHGMTDINVERGKGGNVWESTRRDHPVTALDTKGGRK